ncbi:MAG: TonB-dependent receptor, partial [Sphingomicrobium sp.]
MRRTTILWSTSALATALFAAPALAQSQPASPPDPTVQAQESPADPDQGSPETDDAVQTASGADQAAPGDQTIVVTGIRRSLQSAQNIKRNSQQIVDVVVAEDIGKLPDITASAAVARIPGVQVNRAAGEAAQVQIRGLPDISTTYNGREIFTANDRFVAIQDFPAGSVAALEVFKSSTANLIEGGLGGQVNVRSRRPFDFKGFELSGSLNAVRFTQADQADWNGNILVSNRWDVGDGGEFGVLVNAAMTNIDFLDSTREQSVNMRPGPGGVPIPDATQLFYGSGDRYRPSANVALEYRPNQDLKFYFDGLYQGYRGRDSNFFMIDPLWAGDTVFTEFETDDDGLGRRVRASGGLRPEGFQEFHNAKTDTYQLGGGFSYDMDTLLWSGDIAYTDSKFQDRQENVDFTLRDRPDRRVTFDANDGPGGPGFQYYDYDTTDPTHYLYRGLFDRVFKTKGSDVQMRLDGEWRTGMTNLPKVQFGIRHSNHKASRNEATRYTYQLDRGFSLTDLPLDTGPLECGFDYEDIQGQTCFFGTNYDSVYDNLRELREFSNQNPDDPDFEPNNFYSAREKATAVYGQLRYEFDAGFPIDGNIGLRVVKTKDHLKGNQRDLVPEPDVITPIDRSNSYTDFLPNASIRFAIQPNLQARLAYTETRTRPNFNDLSPSVSVSAPSPACQSEGPTSPQCFLSVSGGNPDLKPIDSRNYDATLEYYFGKQNSLSLAMFRRDIRNFIFQSTEDIPGGEGVNFTRLSGPFNSGKGKIRGFELTGTAFFDSIGLPDWTSGFGVQANYTHINASTELAPEYQEALPGQQDFPGVSKHALNLIGIYEKGPVSARLAYNWRSKFVVNYQRTCCGMFEGFRGPLIQDSLGQLDFSASYTPIENVTIAFDALNILAGSQPIRTYKAFNAAGDTYPWNVKYLERVFSLGVR